MEPDLKKYITSNETKLINEILQCSKNVDDETLQVGSKQYYKNLYEKLLKNYSSLLDDIEKNRLKIDISFYKNELKCDTDECINTYISGTKSYYKMLYKKVSILYSLLLDGIGATKLYFDYQKQHDSNSFFQLLCDLKQREDNAYNIIEAKNKFEQIKSSSFSNLTSDFKNIVKKNPSSTIYYRYNYNSDITNHLSFKPFNLSKQATLEFISRHNLAQ